MMGIRRRPALVLTTSLALAGSGLLAGSSARGAFAFAGHSWYVDATHGSLSTTCAQSDRQHPFKTIYQAMSCVAADAPPPSAPDLVHIAAGTYSENVVITGNVNLLGAGSGTKVIDGGHGGSVISNGSGGNLGCSGSGAGFTVTISGVTITDGETSGLGGGICNDGRMTLRNSIVTANEAGGGGGIANDGSMALVNTTVRDNLAVVGGGIENASPGTVRLNNSPVTGNFADLAAGGIANLGGAMILDNSRVSDNGPGPEANLTSGLPGGGIENTDGGLITLTNSPVGGSHPYVPNDPTAGNEGYNGGGIYNEGSTMTLLNSPVSYNTAQGSGGGIYHWQGGSMMLMNSSVSSNSANGPGGGIYTDGSQLTLKNESIVHNTASDEGGLYDTAAFEPDDTCTGQTGVTMSNTTVNQNTPDNC